MPLYRRLGNWAFVTLVRILFGGRYSDLCYGYNAFWMHVLPSINLDCDGFEVETKINVQVLRGGFKITEVPSFEDKRKYGESHLHTIPDGWRVLMTIFKEAYEHHVKNRGKIRGPGAANRVGGGVRAYGRPME